MTDLLALSIWLERGLQGLRVRQFEKLLQNFPFSQREQPQSLISIHAVGITEPPLLENPVNGPLETAQIMALINDYKGDDVAYRIESWWDLWQFDGEWKLSPARATLACFGPNFDNGTERPVSQQESLRIDFGVDSNFLPRGDVPGSTRMVESNIKSLLRLVHELDSALLIDKRRLETESGENFADRLQQVLTHDLQ